MAFPKKQAHEAAADDSDLDHPKNIAAKPKGMTVGKKLPRHVRKTAKNMARRGMISEKQFAKMMGES